MNMKRKVPVSQPVLGELESQYVNDALKDGAISGFFGSYLSKFEEGFAKYSDCEYGISTTSGTTALHLAVSVLSIGKGDEVLVSTLTNMATFFAVIYQGAIPIPVDIEPDTWNIDTHLIETKITNKTKAIIVVHLFGHPVDMDPVMSIAKKYNLYVIEDCAQAHGATYKGKKVGSIGNVGCFSFYANKMITTGEGGMITVKDKAIAEKAKSLKSLAFGTENKFMHKYVGYNYRMTNLQAALGYAQLKRIDTIINNKRKIAHFYNDKLQGQSTLKLPVEKTYARNVYWMYHVVLQGKASQKREFIMKKLQDQGIETREGFIPYNMQKIFIDKGWIEVEACPRANDIANKSFYLPSGSDLLDKDLEFVSSRLIKILDSI